MGMDLMVFGGIGLVSEIGHHRQSAHISSVAETQSKISSALKCDPAFEKEMWEYVCDPERQEWVWDRIETFKRDNPHLCVGQSRWDFVGKNRLILSGANKKTRAMDSIISNNCAQVVALLCRTYGKLSSIHALEVASCGSFYSCWSALPNREIYPTWNMSNRKVEKLKESFRSLKSENIEKLTPLVRNAAGEQHDAIVYMTGLEFDPSRNDAVSYVVERIKHIIGLSSNGFTPIPSGVFAATTSEQYRTFLDSGGENNPYIADSIDKREAREKHAKGKEPPYNVTYIPDGGELPQIVKDIMVEEAIISAPNPSAKDTAGLVKSMIFDTYFDGSISGILFFILSIVAIASAIAALT